MMKKTAKKTMQFNGLSRRNFLKGAGLAAAGAAATGMLAGCAPSSGGSDNLAATGASVNDIAWDQEADIIAVGGGGAGLSCAIEGPAQGLSVIVLESQPTVGGSSALCNGGISMPNTPLQREQGIEDSPELMYNDLVELTKEDNNPDWIRMHCELAEGLYEWLTGMGLEFRAESLLPTQGQSVPREHHIVPSGVIDTLKNEAEAAGSTILVNTTAVELIQDPATKRVIGVHATDRNNKDVFFKANRGVVLATNGYSRNTDMLNKYIFGQGAENIITFTGSGDLGQGHQMAMAIGADTHHLSWISLLTGQHPEGGAGKSCSLFHGGAILVNAEGERFCDESLGYGNVWPYVAAQTGGICYQIWDDDIAQEYAENDSSLYSMAKLRESGLLITGDTLEDVAEQMGLPADAVRATVDKYNSDIETTGADSLFGRAHQVSQVGTPPQIDTPPFYGWVTGNVNYGTTGGIKHNLDMQVIHLNGDVIPGLYLAGTICTYSNLGIKPGTIESVGASGIGFGGSMIWGRRVAQLIKELESGQE